MPAEYSSGRRREDRRVDHQWEARPGRCEDRTDASQRPERRSIHFALADDGSTREAKRGAQKRYSKWLINFKNVLLRERSGEHLGSGKT